MPIPELPTPSDLAQRLTTAATLLNRKAEIAVEIAALRAEDAKINSVVASWTGSIPDIAQQLQALADAAAAAAPPQQVAAQDTAVAVEDAVAADSTPAP